jgi:hypothetical protein
VQRLDDPGWPRSPPAPGRPLRIPACHTVAAPKDARQRSPGSRAPISDPALRPPATCDTVGFPSMRALYLSTPSPVALRCSLHPRSLHQCSWPRLARLFQQCRPNPYAPVPTFYPCRRSSAEHPILHAPKRAERTNLWSAPPLSQRSSPFGLTQEFHGRFRQPLTHRAFIADRFGVSIRLRRAPPHLEAISRAPCGSTPCSR